MLTIHEAAERRAAGVAAPADRPSQRRSDKHGLTGVTRARPAQMSLRAASEESKLLSFTGYASTYEDPYEMYDMFGPYTEVVSRGAAAESLNRIDLDVPLVLDHDSMRRIASTTTGTLRLSEDEIGLLTEADLDPEDHDVAYIAPKMRAKLIHEMSFRFRIIRGMWSPDYTEYRIDAFDIHRGDVAIVGYGANPGTSSALRDDATPARMARRGLELVSEADLAHIR
jgi:HK97 family phage prohead protease